VDCPACHQSGAYIGLQWIHCQNTDCRYYDARYTEKVQRERSEAFYDSVENLILLRGETLELDDD
jgi:hypothetical protein